MQVKSRVMRDFHQHRLNPHLSQCWLSIYEYYNCRLYDGLSGCLFPGGGPARRQTDTIAWQPGQSFYSRVHLSQNQGPYQTVAASRAHCYEPNGLNIFSHSFVRSFVRSFLSLHDCCFRTNHPSGKPAMRENHRPLAADAFYLVRTMKHVRPGLAKHHQHRLLRGMHRARTPAVSRPPWRPMACYGRVQPYLRRCHF